MEINYRFEDIDNDLEIRIHSIENQLDELLCVLNDSINNKSVLRLYDNLILKSQVGGLEAFGDSFSKVKSVLTYCSVAGEDVEDVDFMYFLFPKMVSYYSMIPKSNNPHCWEISLSCVSFENEILYTCGTSDTGLDSPFIFRIYTKNSLDPDEFIFNDRIGPKFVLNDKTIYFYGKWGINKGFDLISKKFFQFDICSSPNVFKIHVNDMYFIFQSNFNFKFFDKKTTKFLYAPSFDSNRPISECSRITYRSSINSTLLDNYLVKVQSVSSKSINLILVSMSGHIQTRILNIAGFVPDDIWSYIIVSIEEGCVWLKKFNYLIKIQF